MRVLIVCTGNTCRSPLAAALIRQGLLLTGHSGVEVESAGTGAGDGAPASEGAYLVALESGLDLSAHRARLLTKELVDQADLVLTMSRPHLGRVRELGGGSRAHLLGEYAGLAGAQAEVGDPFGGAVEEYRATLRELEVMMPAILARIVGSVGS